MRSSGRVRSNVVMQAFIPTRVNAYTGTQIAAVLVVLLAVFTLPCCPRVDGWFGAAQANAAASEAVASSSDHLHHHGHEHHHTGVTTDDDNASGPHKGHLMATGAVDVLPNLSPIVLAALIPLARVGLDRVGQLSQPAQPRIPVPPPRPAV